MRIRDTLMLGCHVEKTAMSSRERVRKYREVGGAADLVRVEVLVPAADRDAILASASKLRQEHRNKKERMIAFLQTATERYGLRVFDNIDLSRVDTIEGKCRIVADALMERGDARAFGMGRRMLAELEGNR
jgi:hypothetical protein